MKIFKNTQKNFASKKSCEIFPSFFLVHNFAMCNIWGARRAPQIQLKQMLEISKNFQGHNFSPNSWGGTFLKATFSQLPCVKISSKSVKRSSSYIDLKFSRSSLAFVCECSASPLKRTSSLFCCMTIQHKTSIVAGHHVTTHNTQMQGSILKTSNGCCSETV